MKKIHPEGASDFHNKYSLSGKIQCGFCGSNFSRRTHNLSRTTTKACWKCMTQSKRGINYCSDSKTVDEELIKKAFVEALKIMTKFDYSLIDGFLDTVVQGLKKEDSHDNVVSIEGSIKSLKIKKSSLLDAYLEKAISKEDFVEQKERIESEIVKFENKLNDISKISGKVDLIEDRIQNFKSILLGRDNLEEFDDELFRVLIDKVQVGGVVDGVKDPYLLTYVFNLGIDKGNEIIDEFMCHYPFNPNVITPDGFIRRIHIEDVRVRVAIK